MNSKLIANFGTDDSQSVQCSNEHSETIIFKGTAVSELAEAIQNETAQSEGHTNFFKIVLSGGQILNNVRDRDKSL